MIIEMEDLDAFGVKAIVKYKKSDTIILTATEVNCLASKRKIIKPHDKDEFIVTRI